MYPHITTYPLFSGGCSCIKLRTWKVRKSWGLQYLQHLSAVGPAQAMGCQPTNGTNARSAIGVFTMNKIPIPKLSCCFGFIIVFHTFSWFYHGFIIFLSCWAIPSIWVQRCPRACGSGVVWIHRALRRPGLGFKMIQYDLIWFNTHTHIRSASRPWIETPIGPLCCINYNISVYIYIHIYIYLHTYLRVCIYICIHLCAWLTWILKCIYMIWYDSSCFK